MKFIDLSGTQHGKLRVIRRIGGSRFECQCDCGKITCVQSDNLKNGHTKSCGCLRKLGNNKRHGLHKSRLYNVFMTMKSRCYNKNCKEYRLYGARGIGICDQWINDVSKFADWANANGYKQGLAIDRIDVDGNYEPSNCRFVTPTENARNRRNNVKWKGETASQASERLGGGKMLVAGRVRKGWSMQRAFTQEPAAMLK